MGVDAHPAGVGNDWEALFSGAPVGYVVLDCDLRIRIANKVFLQRTGYDGNGRPSMLDFLLPESHQSFQESAQRLLHDEKPLSCSVLIKGEKGPLEKRLELSLGRQGHDAVIHCVMVNIHGEVVARKAELEANENLQRANEELKRKNARIEATLRAGNVAWWEMDARTGTVVFSDRKALMLGYDPARFTHYSDFTVLVHPDDSSPMMQAMEDCLSGRSDRYEYEYRIRGASGEWHWTRDLGVITHRTAEGKPLQVTGVVIETTRLRLQELARTESERKLSALFDLIPMGLSIADGEGKLIRSNQAAEKILGLTPEDLAHRRIGGREWGIIRPDGSPMPPEEFASTRALRTGQLVENVELGLVRSNGEISWLLVSAVPTGITNFELAIAYMDISRRRELELEREKYSNALEALTQPVVVTNTENTIEMVNEAFCRTYGYSRDEVLGQNPRLLNPGKGVYINLGYTAEQYEALFAELSRSVRDPEIRTWEGEIVNRKKDGSLVWVQMRINGVFDQTGSLRHMVGLPINISELRAREDRTRVTLYQALADLAELRDNETGNHMRRVGQFSRILAEAYGMPQRYCEDIEIFAPMHDIGKVGILDSILLAPRRLTPEEFAEMKKHPVLGYNIVQGRKGMELAAAITLNHHERWNGSGYPYGLSGEAIPLSARIVAIADVYDALRSTRPYKKEWTHAEAVAEIKRGSGTHFDPQLVALFEALEHQVEDIYQGLED